MTGDRILIVGVGSNHGDDQAGWLVARQLSERMARPDVTVRVADTPARLLDWIDRDVALIVCDACQGSGPAGSVRRWNWPLLPQSRVRLGGTHDLGLSDALAIADRLGKRPDSIVVWTIEVQTVDTMAPVSPIVQAAAAQLVTQVLAEIEREWP